MFRNTVPPHYRRYDENFSVAQDYDLWARLLRIGEGRVIGEALVDHRVHPRSISVLRENEQRAAIARIAERQAKRYIGGLSSLQFEMYRWFLANVHRVSAPRNWKVSWKVAPILRLLLNNFMADHEICPDQRSDLSRIAAGWVRAVRLRNRQMPGPDCGTANSIHPEQS